MKNKPATGNPQIEEGHTRIANELLDAFNKTKLTDYERRIFGVILRNVYGWQGRKTADISLREFAEGADIDQRHVSRTLRLLIARNMITRTGSTTGIQKKYNEWKSVKPTPHQGAPNEAEGDTPSGASANTPSGGGGTPHEADQTAPHEAGVYRESNIKQESKANSKADAKASGAERPGEKKQGPTFPDGTPDPRNPAVTSIIETIKKTFELPVLDGSDTKNRRAAYLLLGRVKKMAPAESADPTAWALQLITAVIVATKGDDFWKHRLTSAITLNDKFMQIGKLAIARATGQSTNGSNSKTKVYQG